MKKTLLNAFAALTITASGQISADTEGPLTPCPGEPDLHIQTLVVASRLPTIQL